MKRPIVAALAAIACSMHPYGAVRAESPVAEPTSPAPAGLTAEKYKLGNGLEVVLHEDKRTPTVTVNVWYQVGSKDEPAGKNGFAHLFEHVMFQGSRHVPEDTFFKYLEQAGGTGINGTTNTDRTNYFETVPSNRLELPLWLESDRMAFLLDHADEATFKSQRDVVKNERRQNYENAPYGLVLDFVRRELFPASHPYHLLTIGTPEDLDRAQLEDVRAFFRAWYVPNNATLVVCGDFDKTKTKALIDKYFAPIPAGRPPARTPAPPVARTQEAVLDVEADVELARVSASWVTPAFFQGGDAELDVLARVLAFGKTSRLYKRLVYDAQIAQSVSAGQDSMQLASVFQIGVVGKPGKQPDELLKMVDEEIARLVDKGVEPAELARAKAQIRAEQVFELERAGSRANQLNMYNHYTGDPGYWEKDVARIERVTAADVVAAAKKYLAREARVVARTTPKKGAPIAGKLVKTTRGGAP